MIQLISQNALLLAVANLVGFFTAAFFLFKTIAKLFNLIVTYKKNTIDAGIRRFRYFIVRKAYQLAMDAHYLIIFSISSLTNLFLMSIVLGVMLRGGILTEEEFRSSPRLIFIWSTFDNYERFNWIGEVINIAGVLINFAFLAFTALFLFYELRLAGRFRSRWYEKRRLPWTTVRLTGKIQ